MTKEESTTVGVKQIIKDLEESLQQVQETEGCQEELRRAYKAPYPVPFKYNFAASVVLYILYKQGMPYGGLLLLVWFGWQICVNGIYFSLKLYKKMPQIAQWKDKVNINIQQLENTCIVPQQYWHSNALQHFIGSLKSGEAKTVEACIALYEED